MSVSYTHLLRPELLVVREGDDLRGPIRLDGQVDHADRLGGPSALLDAELVCLLYTSRCV